jgi:hypothetical protein
MIPNKYSIIWLRKVRNVSKMFKSAFSESGKEFKGCKESLIIVKSPHLATYLLFFLADKAFRNTVRNI